MFGKVYNLMLLYLLYSSTIVFARGIEDKILYEHNKHIKPSTYLLNYDYIQYKVIRRYFVIDSLPDNINKQLIKQLKEKCGEKWFDFIHFLRIDLLKEINDSLNTNYSYLIWFDLPVGKSFRYKFSVNTNINDDNLTLSIPDITKNPHMKKILSLLDAWEIAKTEIKKRIELYTITLSYDQSCDELDYSFYYRERTINIFRRRNTFFDMLINAHTGEIIYHINTNEFKSEMRYNRCD